MSDQFGVSTQQNILTGGDGVKQYGWSVLGTASAGAIDVNITNAGILTIAQTTSGTGTFVYRTVTGDFDVNTYLISRGSPANVTVAGISATPDFVAAYNSVAIRYQYISSEKWETINYVNGTMANDTTGSDANNYYYRMNRTGNVFTLYSSTDGSSWTQRAQYTRTAEMPAVLQLGIYVGKSHSNTYTAQFDYFQGTYTDYIAGNTATAALTLPAITIDASTTYTGGAVNAALTLPHLTANGVCEQTGNFFDITLPMFTIAAATAATGSVTVELPAMATDGEGLTGNAYVCTITLPEITCSGEVTQENIGNAELILSSLIHSIMLGSNADMALPEIDCDSDCLTGTVSRLAAQVPGLRVEAYCLVSPLIEMAATLPALEMAEADLSNNTGNLNRSLLSLTVEAQGLTGNALSASMQLPRMTVTGDGYTVVIYQADVTLKSLGCEAVGGRKYYQ
ncbi:MAG: hypothetical protein HQL01_12885 [Nitrospirae bacterium]|nr:hypothetical protein [Nitrospirota bacterium]